MTTQIYKHVVASQAIRMNNAFKLHVVTDNPRRVAFEQSGTISAYTRPLRLNRPCNGFSTRAAASYAFDPTSAKITFIHLNFAFHWRFSLTAAGDSFPYGSQIAVNRVSI